MSRKTVFIFFFLWLFPSPGLIHSTELPMWWTQVSDQARQSGYGLVQPIEVQDILKESGRTIFLDVRPAYEYEAGHLPGAVNLEFHQGDFHHRDAEKAQRLDGLLGPDKSRPIIVYCRNYH